jgi:hypothetical protein
MVAGVVTLAADQVDLIDGSVVKGQILAVENGSVRIETTFAGALNIPLEQVKALSTEEPVNVSIAGGPSVLGRLGKAAEGAEAVADEIAPAPADVTALWRQGAESPTERHLRELSEMDRRKWSYEATVAITGRTGAGDNVNAAMGGKATLASQHDRLILAARAERAEDRGVETANREFAGADYSWSLSPDLGWYARSSLEFDRVKSLDLRSSSAAGVSRKMVQTPVDELELRLGASYTYEKYSSDPDFNSPGVDVSVLNSFTHGTTKLNTVLAYLPTFRDSANYRIRHESALEVPITAAMWKFKIGVANEYQNVVPAGVDRFDTTYFTSLLLNWK